MKSERSWGRLGMKYKTYTMEDALDAIIDYRGKTPKKSESGIPTLSAKTVRNNFIDYNNCYYISEEEYKRFMVRGFPKVGDILLTTEAPLGMTAKLNRADVALAQRLLTLRGKSDILDNDYLLYFLQSPKGQHLLKSHETGTTVTGIKQAVFRKLEISIPSITIQKQIAIILSSIDEKISVNTKINENLEQQAQAIFKSWFVDFEPFGGVMPDDWRLGTFSDIIESTLGGDWGKETSTGNYTERVYCIRGADIPEVKAGNKGKMPTRYILPKNFKNKKLIANDIVVEISGGSPTQSTGRVAAISQSLLDRYDCGMVCTNFCRAIKPCEGYSYYTYYYWQYLYDRNVFFSYENGTTGIKNLDLSGFVETESIIIPSIKAIQEFNSLIDSFHSRVFKNGQENENIAALRDTLLPKLMNGEIDVSNVRI